MNWELFPPPLFLKELVLNWYYFFFKYYVSYRYIYSYTYIDIDMLAIDDRFYY